MGAKRQENRIEVAKRRRMALELRQAGATYQQIAERIISRYGSERLPKGYDKRYVWQDLERMYEDLKETNRERAAEVRQLELNRLDRMQVGLWQDATEGDTKAVQKVLNIMERRAKLLGLDAPERFEGNVSVLQSSEYRELRITLMGALEDHPEARVAVAEALTNE